ncbi:hypothetical protein Thicy_0768 [Thiomicrospira cyclica ALM1]|uniref:Uncharacterized protein n=1 Tax=Thiomicrospira cyclica (strain DSM 14477 / JCM 11371 / ALM1) TaxID=717773 RepID=F6DCF4_THICA|nr:hypothetical protein Thicy_0768 [Thiomicrospira cyclica ALM1]
MRINESATAKPVRQDKEKLATLDNYNIAQELSTFKSLFIEQSHRFRSLTRSIKRLSLEVTK